MTDATTIETHISTLFLTPDRVYKLLKPIATAYIDHRSNEATLLAATREIDLNRRMAADVCLGVANVVEGDKLVDRMIVMRRLPAERAMSTLLRQRELTDDDLRRTAKAIACFHSALAPITDADGPGALLAHRGRWEDSFAELDQYVGSVLHPTTDARIWSTDPHCPTRGCTRRRSPGPRTTS